MMNEWNDWPTEGQAGLVAIKSYDRFHGFSPGTLYCTEENYYITELAHFHNGRWTLDNSLKEPEVIAWMPMPEFKTKIIPV